MAYRIANRDMQDYVLRRQPFEGSNCWAEWKTNNVYAVWSYGYHFPMYVFILHPFDGYTHSYQWYGNEDKYSRSTSRQQQQARPAGVSIEWRSTEQLRDIIILGIAGAVAKRMES